MSLWGAVSGYGNLIYHAAGWGEGLVASYEKLVVDCEMLQAIAALLQPVEFSVDDLALEAQKQVPPGGHFWRRSYHATLPRGVLCALFIGLAQ